uniref:Early nodulin-93-like n=1 Tax=Kalanchoe fedtschenkoi TaxID=63787 RepID=A0A7N0T5C8_KALFE
MDPEPAFCTQIPFQRRYGEYGGNLRAVTSTVQRATRVIIAVIFSSCSDSYLCELLNLVSQKISIAGKVMGISTESRDVWPRREPSSSSSFVIPSPVDHPKSRTAKECTQEAARAGAKSAAIACVVTAVPTLIAVRKIPWAKANLNYTAQALIISSASIASYFITADKTILESARNNARYDRRD